MVTRPAPGRTPLTLNFNGTDSFTYAASDGVVDSNVATVTITVTPVNDPADQQDDEVATNEAPPPAATS